MTDSNQHSGPGVVIIRHAIDGAMIGTGGQLLAHQELDNLIEQLEATREALRGVFVWVEVPDSSMGDTDWQKREEAMREAQRVLTSNPAKERQ